MALEQSKTTSLSRRQTVQQGAAICSLLVVLAFAAGCGSSGSAVQPFSLAPATAKLELGEQVSFTTIGAPGGEPCSWSSSDESILPLVDAQKFLGHAAGTVVVTETCGTALAHANVNVSNAASGPIVITAGGTYSGTFASNDPKVAAVTISTDQPVTLKNAVVTSKGNLIVINGVSAGANVTIKDVTGTALDPGVAGQMRGEFVRATKISSLTVDHCSMAGVSFGVEALSSTVTALKIANNSGSNLEDRESDGKGGLLSARPNLGHFIILNRINAPLGAEIAWNQLVNTIGSTSTEDVINIYKSQGSAANPINVHDNYAEGYSSPATASYSGAGYVTDGDGGLPVTAFVTFSGNTAIHASGTGIAIASGHDISVTGTRVVSCGENAPNQWFAAPYAQGAYIWNYLNAPDFYNNQITGTSGGLVRPDAENRPMVADSWIPTTTADVYIKRSAFTDPCLQKGVMNFTAEDAERTSWTAKLTSNTESVGAQP